jgi:hypothetical protein
MAPPALAVWSDLEMEAESKSAMAKFAEENCIEILPVGSDHGERAWRKYFNVAVEPPFNPRVVDREKRRKDIPDSWIFEAATDLLAQEGTILALCFDENLSSALSSIGVVVFREPADVLNHLEAISPVVAETTIGESTPAPTETPLAASLSLALGEFRDHEQKVLGFIAYFSTPAKEEVIELLASSGVEKNISRNVADRLVLANVIRDTGNHYVVTDRRLGELASVAVEEDIIELLSLGAGR